MFNYRQLLTLLCLIGLSGMLAGQADSLANSQWTWSATIASTNQYRGVDFGQTPNFIPTLDYTPSAKWNIGLIATYALNGKRRGYSNTLTVHADYTLFNNLSLSLYDYYFFAPIDEENDFWNWSGKDGQHFLEAQLNYTPGDFSLLAAWNFYGAAFFDTPNRNIYLEASYRWRAFRAFAGMNTNVAVLNFMNGYGVNNLGLEAAHVQPLGKTELIISGQLIYNGVANKVATVDQVRARELSAVFAVTIVPGGN